MKLRILETLLISIFIFTFSIKLVQAEDIELFCGESNVASTTTGYTCKCEESGYQGELNKFSRYGVQRVCCGWVVNKICYDTHDPDVEPSLNITEGLTSETFDSLNPLKIADSSAADDLSTPGGIVTRLLNFLFPLAGLILFALISWGGFEMLISATDQKGMEAGKNRITAAIVGFILLFSSYWMTQIVEVIFGISIL